jgi:hypothetical protein
LKPQKEAVFTLRRRRFGGHRRLRLRPIAGQRAAFHTGSTFRFVRDVMTTSMLPQDLEKDRA